MSLRAEARRAAKRYGLNPHVFVRQIGAESNFNKDAVSPAGAIGVAQIMPATARGWGVDPHDPIASLDAAAKHMAEYSRQYGGYRNALMAYNAGPGAVGKPLPAETRAYIAKILGGHDGGAGTTKGPHTRTIPGTLPQSKTDIDSLLLDSVMSHAKNKSRDILQRLDSGHYQTETPGTAAKTVKLLDGKSAPDPSSVKGTAMFEGHRVAAWIVPILHYARQHGWKGTVSSGFRTLEEQTRIYNSGVRPAAKPGHSNHEGAEFPRGAVDVTDAAGLAHILRDSEYAHQLVWAGAKDPVHFSHPHGGSY